MAHICTTMRPDPALDYQRVEQALRFLSENAHLQPSLDEVAQEVHLSPEHFQKLFRQWAGVSPKQFLQNLTLQSLKQRLLQAHSLEQAAHEAGLGGANRAWELFVRLEAVAPDIWRKQGQGLTLYYSVGQGPFGPYLLAYSERGITDLHLLPLMPSTLGLVTQESFLDTYLRIRWPKARFVWVPDPEPYASLFQEKPSQPWSAWVAGTPFQLKVWQALLRIPESAVCTYQFLAQQVGQPTASRAVGQAVGANPIAYLIPCHRVIRSTGALGDYRWGVDKKRVLLGYEASREGY